MKLPSLEGVPAVELRGLSCGLPLGLRGPKLCITTSFGKSPTPGLSLSTGTLLSRTRHTPWPALPEPCSCRSQCGLLSGLVPPGCSLPTALATSHPPRGPARRGTAALLTSLRASHLRSGSFLQGPASCVLLWLLRKGQVLCMPGQASWPRPHCVAIWWQALAFSRVDSRRRL